MAYSRGVSASGGRPVRRPAGKHEAGSVNDYKSYQGTRLCFTSMTCGELERFLRAQYLQYIESYYRLSQVFAHLDTVGFVGTTLEIDCY